MPDEPAARAAPVYSETLRAPVSWWLGAAAFAVVVWWVFVLATPMAFAVTAGAATFAAIGGALWSYGNLEVGVRDGTVYAGRARIEPENCGGVAALDPERTALTQGRDADARAHLVLRPYITTAVRLDIGDTRDPVPYWLISSRDPQRLAAAIAAAGVTQVQD